MWTDLGCGGAPAHPNQPCQGQDTVGTVSELGCRGHKILVKR